jgi:hypothetical protein
VLRGPLCENMVQNTRLKQPQTLNPLFFTGQAHSLLLLAWLAPPHNLFNLLGPAMSRDGRGEGSRRKTLPPQMITKVRNPKP